MKAQANFNRPLIVVGVVTALILMVPLVAMQFSDEVKWGITDFIVMGALIYSMGISYAWLTRSASGIAYKAASALLIGASFLMIWANLAVGLIGSGPNLSNLMYVGVIAVGITGVFLSRLKPGGMALAMYAVSLSLSLHAMISLLANVQQLADTSVREILGIDGFFALLFLVSGLLFHYADKERPVTR